MRSTRCAPVFIARRDDNRDAGDAHHDGDNRIEGDGQADSTHHEAYDGTRTRPCTSPMTTDSKSD